ncbi:unnamed protein product, partial [Oppiella nova]
VTGLPKSSEFTGKRWIVLCSSYGGWDNYLFQANVYHAYHMFINHGIPAENIIIMHTDDLANNKLNPTPNIVINKINGPDVYHGVPKHYIKNDVTPKNFLGLLKGDPELKAAGKRVVESGPDDHIFVYFTDHGGQGFVRFETELLYATDLVNVLQKMHQDKRYAKMLFYLEACEAGSMFDKVLPNNIDVYAVASSKPDQLSWQCCYDYHRKAMVGGHFSNYWYMDSEIKDFNTETIETQFKYLASHKHIQGLIVANGTLEEAQHYGNLSIGQMLLADFFGPKQVSNATIVHRSHNKCEYVSMNDVAIKLAKINVKTATSVSEKIRYTHELKQVLWGRQYADKHLRQYLQSIEGLTGLGANVILNTKLEVNNRDCYHKFVQAFNDKCFNLAQSDLEETFTAYGLNNGLHSQRLYVHYMQLWTKLLGEWFNIVLDIQIK